MLNENIQTLRKSKGLSQEELALKLNVVRQTVSKWKRGLSVPDAEMLVAIRRSNRHQTKGIATRRPVSPPRPFPTREVEVFRIEIQ